MIMRCGKCGHENSDGYKFCEKCGSKLGNNIVECQYCGKKINRNDRFCLYCGTAQVVNEKELDLKKRGAKKQNVANRLDKRKSFILVCIIIVAMFAIGAFFFIKVHEPKKNQWENALEKQEKRNNDTVISKENGKQQDIKSKDDYMSDDSQDDNTENEINMENEDSEEESITQLSNIPTDISVDIAASSTLSNGDYDVLNLMDGDPDTAWVEGVEGVGIGENITFYLLNDTTVYGLSILPGYLKNEKVYYNNGVPERLKIKADTGYEEIIDISDYFPDFNNPENSMINIDFSEPIDATEINVEILSATAGEKYEDTCISEMYIYTYLPE